MWTFPFLKEMNMEPVDIFILERSEYENTAVKRLDQGYH